MKYICLGYMAEKKWETMSESERNAMLDECFAYDDVLRKNGARIHTVRNLEPTLEDVFLKITGHEVRDQVAKSPSPESRHGPKGWRPRNRVR